MGTKQKDTYGPRRRFKGRMVQPSGSPRSNSNVSKPSTTVFERGQTSCYPTKLLPGQFKVILPPSRVKVTGRYHSWSPKLV